MAVFLIGGADCGTFGGELGGPKLVLRSKGKILPRVGWEIARFAVLKELSIFIRLDFLSINLFYGTRTYLVHIYVYL